ncbi:hypothetical protein ACFTWF_42020 [Rhodococcus sp. NPDC056960]|uniref:hypothetical protein n=1 Tax=Rhodococcus sp. NPDC056960 TaxID=3345982 RepID=UPI003635E085
MNPLYRGADLIPNKPIDIVFGEKFVPNPAGKHIGRGLHLRRGGLVEARSPGLVP